MLLNCCTLTGVDEKTKLRDLELYSATFPFVEFGFLYSPKQAGSPGRYPSVDFLRKSFIELRPSVKVALHVCGQGVLDLVGGEDCDAKDLARLVAARGGRIQLNFSLSRGKVNLDDVSNFIDAFSEEFESAVFITQSNPANIGIEQKMAGSPNHAILFDASGGQGKLPDGWSVPMPGLSCGYAGGLGPDTLSAQLELIAAAAGAVPFWIDMEGKLRTADESGMDWFDLDKVRRCLEIVEEALVRLRPVGTLIPIEHENMADLRKWGMGLAGMVERCYFCQTETRYWFHEKNEPVCPGCAMQHHPDEVKKEQVKS